MPSESGDFVLGEGRGVERNGDGLHSVGDWAGRAVLSLSPLPDQVPKTPADVLVQGL